MSAKMRDETGQNRLKLSKEDRQQFQLFYTKYRNNKPELIESNASDEALNAIERFVTDCIASQQQG